MKSIVAVLAAALLCGMGTAAARPPAFASSRTDSARQEVIRLEQHWLANEHSATLQSTLLASDFVHVLPEGFLSRQQQLQYLRSHPDTFHGTRRFARLQVRVYGDVAIATGIVLSSPTQGRATRSLFTDVFVLRHGRWLVVNSQENAATTG